MFSDPLRTANTLSKPRFLAGNEVVLDSGPYKYLRGVFLHSNEGVEWGTIQKQNGHLLFAVITKRPSIPLGGC